jgi:hypothetical protein
MRKFLLIGSVFSSVIAASLLPSAKAATIIDSFPSSAATANPNPLIASGASRPLGVPLFTPSTGRPFNIDSFGVSLSKNSSATAQLNSVYNFQVSLYQYDTTDSITTTGTGVGRNVLLPLNNGTLVASNTFTLASDTLSNAVPSVASPAERSFSRSTPNQSVSSGLSSLFDVSFEPSQYYLLLFSNPVAASTGTNGAATGNATYNLRMTGSTDAIANIIPDTDYLRWNDTASSPCSDSVAPTTLADGQTCRYPLMVYSTNLVASPFQIWLQIDTPTETPIGTPVPVPLPVLGALSAFHASRRLRKRLKAVTAIRRYSS